MEPIRVLYVEDDAADWELTRRHLERHAPHLKPTRAETVGEALDQLAAGGVDLVLSDYRLPDGTGLELLETVRARGLRVPIVLVTGSGDAEAAVRLLKAGAADYVVKRPDYLTTLPAVIEGAFRWFQVADELRRARIRVLYAEHDPVDVELTQRAFGEYGAQVQLDIVWRGGDALRRLQAVPYDLFLLDYRLPDLVGLEVLKALREQRIRVPVVMVTGQGDEDTAVQAMKLGAADYIIKREGYLAKLPSTLENVLAQRRLADEREALLVLTGVTRSLASTRDPQELAERTARAAAELLRADVGVLWLADGPDLVPAAWVGLDDAAARGLRLRPEEPSAARAMVDRRVPLHDLVAAVRPPAGADLLRDRAHALAVSLLGEDRPAGLLAVGSRLPREFRSGEERLLTILADHARVALENAGLYGRLTEQLEELQRTQARLVQTEKLAAMGQILAGVAHELNNPLSVVVGHAGLLREMVPPGPLSDRIGKIEQAGERCARIVKSFLALARQRAPERRPVHLQSLVAQAVELLAYSLRVDDIQVTLDLAPDLPVLWADPDQIHQVLVNLVGNAHHAMRAAPPPRRLSITARRGPARDRVTLEVADTGPGVPPELRERIFEPFFTTKPPGQGTGLGLSLCRGMIETHGGTLVLVESGRPGAVFRIELPVTGTPGPERPAPERPPATGRGRRILLVEDEPEVAQVLVDVLRMAGHRVEVVGDGLAALDRLAAETYDLIVSDLRMPRLDGPGLYREVERRAPELCRRFVFMTGDALRPETLAFLEEVGAPSLHKPFDLDEVRRVIG